MAYSQTMDVRGRKYEEIAQYFSGVISCKVELTEMDVVQMGAISFERVMVTVIGDKKNVTGVIEAFRLHFLTAGG